MDKIFRYTNYRQFLSDYYEYKKSTTTFFSYRYFALKAEISSPSLLKRVIDGKRNLSKMSIEQFIKGLGLSSKEAQYFRVLVHFNQSSSPDEKQGFYQQLLGMSSFTVDTQLSSDQYLYLSKWYHPVVRELVTVFDFQNDFQKLAHQVFPPITTEAAQRSFEMLTKLKLIKPLKNGLFKQTNKALNSGSDDPDNLGLVRRNHHKQNIQKALDSLDEVPLDERHALGINMGLSKAGYQVLLQEITAFRERVVTLVDKDKGTDRVYQFNMQLFPMSFPVITSHDGLLTDIGETKDEF